MSRTGRFLVVFVVAAACAVSAPAQLQVQFAGQTLAGKSITLKGLLDMPEGRGPFPAVVLLHDGEGYTWHLGVARYAAWAERLKSWGYVALRVDSMGSRGITDPASTEFPSPEQVSRDAYAARAYLAGLPEVDQKRMAVMGWSHGAAAGLYVVDGAYRPAGTQRFQAVVAYYPFYPSLSRRHDTPLLLLHGSDDTDCLPSMVNAMVQAWTKGDRKAEFVAKGYPGTKFGFDVEGLDEVFQDVRYTYDPVAAADAIEQVKAFLEKHIGRPAR
jgi:dienelactone hydrolase